MTVPALTLDRSAHPAVGAVGPGAGLARLVAAGRRGWWSCPVWGRSAPPRSLVSWSHAGRLRSEAALAALAGANPIPASLGR